MHMLFESQELGSTDHISTQSLMTNNLTPYIENTQFSHADQSNWRYNQCAEQKQFWSGSCKNVAGEPGKHITESTFVPKIEEMDCEVRSLEQANVWLESPTLWQRFNQLGNEMIITKTGRRMFPVLAFGVCGLDSKAYYKMSAVIAPFNNNRYKYVSASGWRVNGVAAHQDGNKTMFHPDAIQAGHYWQRNGVAFKRIKLTNKKEQKEGSNHITLNSMHKYYAELRIEKFDKVNDKTPSETRTFPFKETAFVSVTAYQNDDVTQLKIDYNPFAKAFRDSSSGESGSRPNTPAYYQPGKKRIRPCSFDFDFTNLPFYNPANCQNMYNSGFRHRSLPEFNQTSPQTEFPSPVDHFPPCFNSPTEEQLWIGDNGAPMLPSNFVGNSSLGTEFHNEIQSTHAQQVPFPNVDLQNHAPFPKVDGHPWSYNTRPDLSQQQFDNNLMKRTWIQQQQQQQHLQERSLNFALDGESFSTSKSSMMLSKQLPVNYGHEIPTFPQTF